MKAYEQKGELLLSLFCLRRRQSICKTLCTLYHIQEMINSVILKNKFTTCVLPSKVKESDEPLLSI